MVSAQFSLFMARRFFFLSLNSGDDFEAHKSNKVDGGKASAFNTHHTHAPHTPARTSAKKNEELNNVRTEIRIFLNHQGLCKIVLDRTSDIVGYSNKLRQRQFLVADSVEEIQQQENPNLQPKRLNLNEKWLFRIF